MSEAPTSEPCDPLQPQEGTILLSLDVDKSKFFDANYAVLEGDVACAQVPGERGEAHIIHTSKGKKKRERCFVVVKQHVSELYKALVPQAIARDRKSQGQPDSTGWLRHEMYGLFVTVEIPIPSSKKLPKSNKSQSTSTTVSSTSLYSVQQWWDKFPLNKRGIKCLDFPGNFLQVGRLGEETDNTPQYSADQDDILTIQQCELQERLTRHELFVDWLENTYGREFLSSGSGVLDVAGGNGKLSIALSSRGIPCTILDPLPLLKPSKVPETVKIIAQPLKGDGSHLWAFASILESDETNMNEHNQSYLLDHPSAIAETVRNCSMVVGLHPDEATEGVVDLAQSLQKPFAVLPCCVMTRQFPHRRNQRTGDPVRTVWDLCRYLLDKGVPAKDLSAASTFSVDFLPFAGRNKVIYSTISPSLGVSQPLVCKPVTPIT
eukprot:Nitzschia sp. Nitz4//scaffold26_size159584//41586//42887//NITZ4_002478-RA/size159584-processed-gene-0.188-mRNA-1//1//CDS//3329545043//4831//frame0